MQRFRILLTALATMGLVFAAAPASADHGTEPASANMKALGHSPQPATFDVPDGERVVSSDLAFQGNYAYQGNYDGFRIIDITNKNNPQLISHAGCNGDQGDIVVWNDILVRSWNTKRSDARDCSGLTVPAGWEGVHVFDISDPYNPAVVGALELPCGSHTITVAGVYSGNLIVYSNISSSSGCGVDLDTDAQNVLGDFMDIIAVPLDDPASVHLARREALAGPTDTAVRTGCHDAGVILGGVNKAVCASADTINVWDISDPVYPNLLLTITEPGVGDSTTNGRWHSAGFTWDGNTIVAGWEPGGGGAGECEASDPDVDKTMFFYDANTGAKLGEWVLPNAQGADENCTIHNYNLVPLRNGRDVVVSGNYQAGTWVTDITDPAAPFVIAYSDPVTLGPGSFCGGFCQIGGSWSSYWYNNFIYESDITRGLNVFKVTGTPLSGALVGSRLNPQTLEMSLP